MIARWCCIGDPGPSRPGEGGGIVDQVGWIQYWRKDRRALTWRIIKIWWDTGNEFSWGVHRGGILSEQGDPGNLALLLLEEVGSLGGERRGGDEGIR